MHFLVLMYIANFLGTFDEGLRCEYDLRGCLDARLCEYTSRCYVQFILSLETTFLVFLYSARSLCVRVSAQHLQYGIVLLFFLMLLLRFSF